MRYVKREKTRPRGLSADQVSREKKEAKDYFEKKLKAEAAAKAAGREPPKSKPFKKFKLYKDASIREALERMFFGKCAYCESRYAGIHPVDIEHWRPKAEVIIDEEGKDKRYGYYWLAASWENLLPSCIDCNRTRKHKDFLEKEKKEVKVGKGNWFPLANEADRATQEDEESKEEPLLLNPCQDKPEEYLEFHDEGYVKAKSDARNQPSAKKKADASIKCYALNRTELVLDRRERVLIIQQKMYTIRKLAELLQSVKTDSLAELVEDLLTHELNLLDEFEQPNQPFSMMAKQMIEEFRETFKDNN